MPREGPLVDRFARVHTDLRVSITDRCNLRCVYCMPEDGLDFSPRDELLGFDEIARVARVARRLGISSVRITGGEPLVRHGIVELVAALGSLGFDDLALTTNGTSLRRLAPALVAAGLQRVNVSCDSLRPDRFAAIRRRGDLATVLDAMDGAEQAGLPTVKVNVVVMAGVNDDEIIDFAAFARSTRRTVRFIEFMPLDADGRWQRDGVVPMARVVEAINERWPIEAVAAGDDPAPATRYRFVDGAGEIGVIASVTQPFCGTCNRVRLTSDGSLRNCLFSDDEIDVRAVLRGDGSDDDLERAFRVSVWGKRAGHGLDEPGFLPPRRSMSRIGG
jgi:cyclic pyranopterin phosphate synthase